MTIRFITTLLLLSLVLNVASAQSDDDIDWSAGPCEAIGAGLGALGGYSVAGVARQTAVGIFTTAAGAAIGHSSFSEPCGEWLEEYAEHYSENPVDYDEFVEEQCDGNPLACPGNLNPWESPYTCFSIIDCTAGGMPTDSWGNPLPSLSVNNVIQLIDHSYYSFTAGYWLPEPSLGTGCGGGFCDPE